ncbi:cutinase family protein [Microbacterium sp. F51-2R]|uniref:cutinase family protein n=1 Tax=Microbacterium sp. F51-2R TaxID=3445777 RepID=UPI003FA18589
MRRITATIASIVSLIVAGVIVVAQPAGAEDYPPLATTSSSCMDVVVIGAQGSGQTYNENRGLGPEVWHGLNYYVGHMAGYDVGYFAIPYPSADVWVLATKSTRKVFWESIDSGVTETLKYLEARISRCPDEHYVLAGYSQGAMVMHRTIQLLATGKASKQLNAAVSRVDGVLAIADGDRAKNQGGISYDTAPLDGAGIWWVSGTGGKYKPGAIVPDVPAWPATRFHSVCHDDDVVCDPNLFRVDYGLAVHTEVYRADGESAAFVASAATAIAQQSKQLQPTITSLTLPAAIAGTSYSAQLVAAGGTEPYRWTQVSGLLPSGLSLAESGLISGVSSDPGSGTFDVELRDAQGVIDRATIQIVVSEAVVGEINISLSGAGCKLPGNSNGTYKGYAFAVSINNTSSIPVTIQSTSITLNGVSLGDTALVDLVPPVPEVDPNPFVLAPNGVAAGALLTGNASNSQNGTLTITYTINGGTPISVSTPVSSLPPIENASCTAFTAAGKEKLALLTGIPL